MRSITESDRSIDSKYIDVLDGIRAISVIIVLIFHFWQQTWIWPQISTPFLAPLGIKQLDINALAQVGYLFVDAMVLLSGFLLFLPLARHVICGEPMIDWKNYARKRAARILPSYLFCIIVLLFTSAIPNGSYPSIGAMLRDLIAHLTFTQTFWYSTYIATSLNVVLWTVAIEVMFYILFPFAAKFIGRRADEEPGSARPLHRAALVYLIFNAAAWFYIYAFVLKKGSLNLSMYINQLPAFLGVYANGMAGAMLFVSIAKSRKRTPALEITCTVLAIASLFVIGFLVKDCAANAEPQVWQMTERFKLSFAFMTFIITCALSMKWFRWLFSNRLMRFLSSISYNLYIWHQWLAVQFKTVWRIPHWEGDVPPNQLYDNAWMWKYAVIITVAAFVAATLATYLIEKPAANLILGKPAFPKRQRKEARRS